MGKVVYFGLFLLGCFVFGSSGVPVEEANDNQEESYCRPGEYDFRNICYVYFPSPLPWHSAEAACQKNRQGAHLASFSNPTEEKMVSAHIRSRSSTNHVWIGFHAVPESNQLHWGWSDRSPYTSGSSLWDNQSPSTSSSSQQCVALSNVQNPSHSTRWSQYTCDSSWPYVCEYKPGN